MPGKINSEAQEDILSQIANDEEDFEQLGPEDDEGGDDSQPSFDDNDEGTTGPVEDDPKPAKAKKETAESDEEFDPKKRYKQDKDGNLVDDNGKIVARAGKERGIVEKLKRRLNEEETTSRDLASQLGKIASATRELMDKYRTLNEQKSYGSTLGLTDQEQREAMELTAMSKTDPKGALKKILTKYHLNGNDLSDLGVTGPLDPAEVARHILEQQEAKKPKATDPVDTPEMQEARAFAERHPDFLEADQALVDAVVKAKNRFPEKTFDEIWIRIKQYVAGQDQQPPQPQQQPKTPQRPVPHNSSTPRGPAKKGLDITARNPSKSFNDIGRELLAELKTLEEN